MSRRLALPLSLLATTALALVIGAGSASAKSRLDGSLTITNDRRAPVTIRIDGTPRGSIPGKTTARFDHVPNGIRLVKIKGPRGHKLVHEVKVRPRRQASLRVAPIFGKARVVNRTGVTMRVAIDGRFAGTVSDGGTLLTQRMRAGTYRVTATPIGIPGGSSARLQKTLHLRPGADNRIKLKHFLSSLRVVNPFNTRARLFVDGRSQGKLLPGQSVTLNGLYPGAHRVKFRRKGRVLSNDTVTVAMGASRKFVPAVPTGRLKVRNDRRRSVSLTINGRNMGQLAPGQVRIFSNMPVGPVTVQAHGRRKTISYDARVSHRSTTRVNIQRRPGQVRTAGW